MKIFISADIEGTIGVLDWSECREEGYDYERARKYMTREVISATNGALESGATKVVVKDGHKTGRNIIIDDLPEEVEIVSGWSGHPFRMMQELDDTFDGVAFTGYHTGAGCGGNNLAHTISSTVIKEIRINGEKASEYLINSYIASYVGVPVIFLSGDEKTTEEVRSKNLGIETVAVKRGVGGSVVSVSLSKGLRDIESGMKKAVKNIKDIKILPLPEKFNLEMDLFTEEQAVKRSHFPGMKRKGVSSIEGELEDCFELIRALLFLAL